MCLEIGTAGAFNGLGKTIPPSIVGVSMNFMRIPIAIVLANHTSLGLSGVWWSISVTGIIKGIILSIWFKLYLNKRFSSEL